MQAREKTRRTKNFPTKRSPGGAARKRREPIAEVTIDGEETVIEGSAVIELKKFVKALVAGRSIPWRDAFKKELAQGEPAAMLRGARARADMTQAELAKELGTDQPNVAAMESGKRTISKKTAEKLGEIFKLDYRLFL